MTELQVCTEFRICYLSIIHKFDKKIKGPVELVEMHSAIEIEGQNACIADAL